MPTNKSYIFQTDDEIRDIFRHKKCTLMVHFAIIAPVESNVVLFSEQTVPETAFFLFDFRRRLLAIAGHGV
jgi:hypothetical protein